MRLLLSLIILVSLARHLTAQEDGWKQKKRDSLTLQLKKDSAHIFRPKIAKPYLRVENRYSFFSKQPVNLVGFMAGATFYGRHIICAGYYIFNPFTEKPIELIDENNVITREYLSLNYFVFSYQYIFINRRYFQVHAPFEIGYGIYDTRTTDHKNIFVGKSSGNIVPISLGLQFIFKPIKWIGISTIGGYRHAVQEKNTNLNFTGFYFSFGIWVDARHVLRYSRYYLKKQKYKDEINRL